MTNRTGQASPLLYLYKTGDFALTKESIIHAFILFGHERVVRIPVASAAMMYRIPEETLFELESLQKLT